ncbi:MAG: alkaline phosphatase family protein, partial [Candidatus Latescibacterota bacterium]
LPELPPAIERRARTIVRRLIARRGVIQGYYDLYDIPLHLLKYFDVASRQDPYLPGSMPVESLFDALIDRGISYRLWNYRTPERENMRDLISAMQDDHSVLFFYTAELDALMHRYGIFHEAVGEKLTEYQRFIERILEEGAKSAVDVRIHIFSDHGMIDVAEVVDLWGAVTRRGYRIGRDYMAFYDSTMARFWCDGDVAAGINEQLAESGWGRMLLTEELVRLGCMFEDNSYGNQIFLLSPGRMIIPSFMGTYRVAAMHGYDPADKYSQGCILTNQTDAPIPDSILGIKAYLLSQVGGRNHGVLR